MAEEWSDGEGARPRTCSGAGDEWMNGWGRSAAGPRPHTCVGAAHPARAARRLVSGSGDIKLTKDGNVLLQEMVSWGCSSHGD